MPQRHICDRAQVGRCSVITIIVHKQKVRHPKLPIVLQKIGQPHAFVSDTHKAQNVLSTNVLGTITGFYQVTSAAETLPDAFFPAPPELVALPC